MINPNDWLGRWEPPVYHGKHDKREPVNVFCGYRYNATTNGNGFPAVYDAIVRAIPVEGHIDRLSWENAPQAAFWLDPPRKTLWKRFLEWWRR